MTGREGRLVEGIRGRAAGLLEQLAAYVAIPTGQGYEPGLVEFRRILAERLRGLGADVSEVPGSPRPTWLDPDDASGVARAIPPCLLARGPHVDGPRLLIVGHLDTVHDPHGPFQGLQPSDDGLTVVGPGAVDMKGGIVIALAALEALREGDIEVRWTMLLNADEETGSFHSDATLCAAAREHDIGIVLEPALPDGALAIERMGSGQFMVEAFGRSAHVGRAFAEGRSAVVALARTIVALDSLARPEAGMIVNPGPLRGPQVSNAVAEYAACWGNARFADSGRAEELGVAIDALGSEGEDLPRISVHRVWNRPAKPTTDAVRALAETARSVAESLGSTLPFTSTGGVCDGNILQAEGLPTLDTLGVRGGNLHRPDEFVEVASLVERAQLLALLLRRLSNPA